MVKTEKLSKLCHISSGGTPSRSNDDFYGGAIPWAKIGDIEKSDGVVYETKEYITKEGLSNIRNRIFPEGTLLFSMYGSVGKVAFAGKEMATNQAILGMQLKEEAETKLDLLYLSYFFRSNIEFLKRRAVGGILKNLSATIVKNFDIPLPSIDDQKTIGVVLSHCEELINKRNQSIDLMEKVLRSTFSKMFGDPSRNPKNWRLKIFDEHIEYIGDIGSNGSNARISKNLKMHDEENYALMVRTTNLKSNDFSKKVKYFTKETYEFFSKSKIYGGEIIMNKIGSAGEFWIMPSLNRPVSLGLNQLVIRLKNINEIYLYHYFTTNYGKQLIQSKVKGAVTKSITKGAVKALPLLYPPIELQNEFEQLVIKIEEIKAKYKKSKIELENLFGSISQKAFRGELDLSKIDITTMEGKDQDKLEKEPVGESKWVGKVKVQDYKVNLDEIIKNDFRELTFSFEELEKAVSDRAVFVPYENIKSFVFEALEGEGALLEQLFDDEKKEIVFKIK
jgi:type I restriction enzyme S subunit